MSLTNTRFFALTFPVIFAACGVCAEPQAKVTPATAKAAATAVSPVTQDTARERAITAQNFVLEKLAIWQKRLKLQDWDISATLIRQTQLKPKTLGNIDWDTPTKTAHIHVLALEDYKMPYKDALADMEFTVVHELVHLSLSDLPRSEASRGAEEHAVNRITQTMLDLVKTGGQ